MSQLINPEISRHVPVLLNEICDSIKAANSASKELLFLDCTLGGGGHTGRLLELFPNCFLIGIDQDREALERTRATLQRFAVNKRLHIFNKNFSELNREFIKSISGLEVFEGKVDAIVLDLGISSDQLDSKVRGFSFRFDSKLDMRMNLQSDLTAHTVLNHYPPKDLLRIFRCGGLSKKLKPFVNAIIYARPLESSLDFLNVCERVFPGESAALPFQAVRMEVNQELASLERFLQEVPNIARANCVFAAISFHSLEDQCVTRKMRVWCRDGGGKSERQLGVRIPRLGKLLTKKAILPSAAEIEQNPRARSAKLRVFHFEQ